MQNHKMRDGKTIPPIGLGTYGMDDTSAELLVSEAIRRGYRLIDTAKNYENESGVGKGVLRSGVDREEIFVISKIPGRDHGYEEAKASIRGSLERMGLDYLDMVLIHWPNPSQGKFVDTWRGLMAARDEGLVKSIGVSNFLPEHINQLVEETGEYPAANEIELNPYYQQESLHQFNDDHAILTISWAPLGNHTDLLGHSVIAKIAEEVQKTPAQVILRWHVQNQLLPIPRTLKEERLEENFAVFSWELSDQQMKEINLLHTGISGFNFDPATHEEM